MAQTVYVEPAIDAYEGPVVFCKPFLQKEGCGDADETVPFKYGEIAVARYKNASLVRIEGDTHCFDNHLDQMIDAVSNWFGGMIR